MERSKFSDEEDLLNYPVHEEPIILSKSIMDLLLKEENATDIISLYIFYYYTAKWQGTNQPRATRSYCMNALKIGKDRFQRAQRALFRLGLINIIQKREGGKYINWYIKIKFLWSTSKTNQVNHRPEKPPVVGSTRGSQAPNALSTNREMYLSPSPKKLNNKPPNERNIIPPTIDMVAEYCRSRNNNVDPEKFHDFYTSKGWYVGKLKMKDWQASVRTWEKDHKSVNGYKPKKPEYIIDDGIKYTLGSDGRYHDRIGGLYIP